MGVFPYRVLARYTQSKPHLVVHLPVTNEKRLGGPPLEKRDAGVNFWPLAHLALTLVALMGGRGLGLGAESAVRYACARVMVKHENKSWWSRST